MSAKVTVFTKPSCVQCDSTKNMLDIKGIPYDIRDVMKDPSAMDEVLSMGYRTMPVVKVGDIHWCGFDNVKIEALTA